MASKSSAATPGFAKVGIAARITVASGVADPGAPRTATVPSLTSMSAGAASSRAAAAATRKMSIYL